MRTYTEEEVLKIINYACGLQKAEDYQVAGNMLLVDNVDIVSVREQLLNYLCDTDNNESKNITIEIINEYLEE